MSMYTAAISNSMNAALLAYQGDNAETRALYDAQIARSTKRRAAARRRVAGERNISAIRQSVIMSNANIRQQQAEKAAASKVAAAVAGVRGDSVDATEYEHFLKATMSLEAVARQGENAIEGYLAGVYEGMSTMMTTTDVEVDNPFAAALMNTAGSVTMADLQLMRETFGSKDTATPNLTDTRMTTPQHFQMGA